MLAAAVICNAHPQSTDATLAMLPTVFESSPIKKISECDR